MSQTINCPSCQLPQEVPEDTPAAGGAVYCRNCGVPLPPPDAAPRPATILWIDDDQLLLQVCREPFERHGYQLLCVNDGPAGIALAREAHPDLILLDVLMVGMDGLEVCACLRAEPALATTPIVLLTVLDDARVRDRGRAVGATALWSKACGPTELLAKVAHLLGHPPAGRDALTPARRASPGGRATDGAGVDRSP